MESGILVILYIFYPIRDYAATLATVIKNWFLEPLGRGKSTNASFLDSEFSPRRHDSISFPDKILFPLNIGHVSRPEPRQLNAMEFKDTRPEPPGNGEPGERLRPHANTTSGFDYWLSAGKRRYSGIAPNSYVQSQEIRDRAVSGQNPSQSPIRGSPLR
jgi:hypothetical protein